VSASTGPILAMGAITMANQSLFNGKPIDWRVPVATAIAAGIGAGAEQLLGGAAVRGMALIALGTILLTRVDRSVPAPAESALKWWRERG
jgi:hypothetical protein